MAIKPDFEVTNENAAAVAEICARLDGLPLAIELAASRVKILPPKAMLGRLQNRLKLLTSGERDLPSRQQTLRGAIDWSYNLLSEDEQMLFRRLSIFTGGCSLNALEALCQRGLNIDVLDGLESLVDKSLLQQEEQENGEPRFRDAGNDQGICNGAPGGKRGGRGGSRGARKHLRGASRGYGAEVALSRSSWSVSSDWRQSTITCAGHFLVAEGWGGGDGPELCTSLWHFWWVRGHLTEGRKWLEATLELAAAKGNKSSEHAKALYALALICRSLRDGASMIRYSKESAALALEINDRVSLAWALIGAGRWARGAYARRAS